MTTEKQNDFINIIINYYNNNKQFPNITEIKKIGLYKSYNSIYQYINKLETLNIIYYDKHTKQVKYIKDNYLDDNFLIIPFLNSKDTIKIDKNKYDDKDKYIAFKITKNNLSNYNILKEDILIISKNINFLNNKFVLTYIDKKYNIYKYIKKDGFEYLLTNKKIIPIGNNSCIIGKVISLIRNNI